jgi:hypothetical protein
MPATTASFTIRYPDWYDERAETEMTDKGYFPGPTVELETGARYELYFYDPVRLGQDVAALAKNGRPYVAEPNMVVVPEVTAAAIRRAVEGLVHDGYFDHLLPLPPAPTSIHA